MNWRIIFIIIVALSPLRAFSQIEEIDMGSVELSSTKKKGNATGSVQSIISDTEIKRNVTRSLSELLLESTSIQIKSMGQGGVATASFRGTSSSHTKVLWNGISINSPQLGGFDFSQLPVYFTDKIVISHGGSNTNGGSGAIGGTISLSNNSLGVKEPILSLISEYGTNNSITNAINFRATLGKLTSSTRAYFQSSDNDYLYLNKVYSKDDFYERRRDADYKQGGVMQEFYYKTVKGDNLSLIGWWQYDDRSIPQPIMINYTQSEQSSSSNIRAVANYNATRGGHKFNASLGYINSRLYYDRLVGGLGDKHTTNINRTATAKIEYQYSGWKKIDFIYDMSYRNEQVVSDNYTNGTAKRNTYSARTYLLYRPTRRLHVDGQATVESADDKPYLLYSISAKYFAVDHWLTLKASHSYNHRTPTLNDLFWSPGGNPDLKPETGDAWDITIESNPSFGAWDINFSATYYHMDMDNWIMWLPEGAGYIWRPANFKSVTSQGVEIMGGVSGESKNFNHEININYTYAYSVDNSDIQSIQGKQLPYIPRNRWSANYHVWYKSRLWAHYNVSFTDKRYTSSDEHYWTNSYYLHNAEIGYLTKIFNKEISVTLKCENIFNSYYESTQYYPMPLRMIWARVNIIL